MFHAPRQKSSRFPWRALKSNRGVQSIFSELILSTTLRGTLRGIKSNIVYFRKHISASAFRKQLDKFPYLETSSAENKTIAPLSEIDGVHRWSACYTSRATVVGNEPRWVTYDKYILLTNSIDYSRIVYTYILVSNGVYFSLLIIVYVTYYWYIFLTKSMHYLIIVSTTCE